MRPLRRERKPTGNLSPMDLEIAREALKGIVGLPLTDAWIGGGWRFEFGEQKPFINRKGFPATRADWSLVAETWRVDGPEGSLYEADFPTSLLRADFPFFTRMRHDPLVVEAVTVHEDGALTLALTEDHHLAIHRGPKNEEGVDIWILITPRSGGRGTLFHDAGPLVWEPPR